MTLCYVDTSALAKRYVNEAYSDEVEACLAEKSLLVITSLTRVEFRSVVGRRRRMRAIDAGMETQIYASFLDDIRQGYLSERDLVASMFEGAVNVIGQLPRVPLRTLDAIHLAALQQLGLQCLVTADRTMRDAAHGLDIPTDFFGSG